MRAGATVRAGRVRDGRSPTASACASPSASILPPHAGAVVRGRGVHQQLAEPVLCRTLVFNFPNVRPGRASSGPTAEINARPCPCHHPKLGAGSCIAQCHRAGQRMTSGPAHGWEGANGWTCSLVVRSPWCNHPGGRARPNAYSHVYGALPIPALRTPSERANSLPLALPPPRLCMYRSY
jgi:hypothetical protein